MRKALAFILSLIIVQSCGLEFGCMNRELIRDPSIWIQFEEPANTSYLGYNLDSTKIRVLDGVPVKYEYVLGGGLLIRFFAYEHLEESISLDTVKILLIDYLINYDSIETDTLVIDYKLSRWKDKCTDYKVDSIAFYYNDSLRVSSGNNHFPRYFKVVKDF